MKVEWEQQEPGWYTARDAAGEPVGVCFEYTGLWHGYIRNERSDGFKTKREAQTWCVEALGERVAPDGAREG